MNANTIEGIQSNPYLSDLAKATLLSALIDTAAPAKTVPTAPAAPAAVPAKTPKPRSEWASKSNARKALAAANAEALAVAFAKKDGSYEALWASLKVANNVA